MNVASLFGYLGFKTDVAPLARVEQQLDGIKTRLSILGAAEFVRGVYHLTERYGGLAEQIGLAANAAGITVEQLQRIQYAAGQAGISAEDVSQSMARLTRAIYEARQGDESSLKAFAELGISPSQIASFKNSAEAFASLSDGMMAMEDPIKKQAITLQLLGRGASNMVEFLSEGSEQMRELGVRAERYGTVIDKKTIQALREAEDAIASLFQSFRAFAATVAGYAAPAMKTFAVTFSEFYAAYKDVILLNIKRWFQDVANNFGYLIGVVLRITEEFLNFAEAHPVIVSGLGTVLRWLGLVSIGLIVFGKFIGVAKGAWDLMGDAMKFLSKPFKWVLMGIAGIQIGLVGLLAKLAELTIVAFPGLGTALISAAAYLAALPLWAVIGGIAILTTTLHDLWTMLTGGRWEDTWLYKILHYGSDALDKLLSKTGLDKKLNGLLGIPEAVTANARVPFLPPGETQTTTVPPKMSGKKISDYINSIRGEQDDLDRRIKMMDEISRGIHDLKDGGQARPNMPLAAASQGDRTVNMTNNFSVAVPPGATPQEAAEMFRKVVQDETDRAMRQAHNALAGPMVQ